MATTEASPLTELTDEEIAWADRLAKLVHRAVPISERRENGTYRIWADIEDYQQDARLAALQAKRKYKPSRNSSYGGYAYKRVKGAVYDKVRRRHFDQAVKTVGIEADIQPPVDPRLDEQIDGERAIDRVRAIIRSLPPLDRRVMSHLMRGQKPKQIARFCKLAEPEVIGIRDRAFATIRREMRWP